MKVWESPYRVEVEKIDHGPKHWKTMTVRIFCGDKEIGSYERDYSSLYNTFHPFIGPDGRHFALYSPQYTTTRIMELPSCRDLGGESPGTFGFCPTGYAVPCPSELEHSGIPHPTFGFMCGCVWGDDSSWKIQYLDLSKVGLDDMERNGAPIIKREPRFGYIELLDSADDLKDAIELDLYCDESEDKRDLQWFVRIAAAKTYNLIKSEPSPED